MSFFRDVSASGAFRGLIEQWQGNPHRWRVLAVSIALTSVVMYLFIPESRRGPPKPFEVVYISTFADDRTDEEIIASNIANQKVQEERRALQAQREQIRKDAYEALGRASGLDVDAMKADIAREEAERERERERRRAEILARAEEARRARTGLVGSE